MAAEENPLRTARRDGKLLAAIDITSQRRLRQVYGLSPVSLPAIGTGRRLLVCKMSSTSSSQLARIDLETGVTAGRATHAHQPDIMGMTFSRTAFSAGGNLKPTCTPSIWLRARPAWAPSGRSLLMSFAFDASGRMYGASVGALYEINPATGAATVADFAGAHGHGDCV
jgi:hypothetical protein